MGYDFTKVTLHLVKLLAVLIILGDQSFIRNDGGPPGFLFRFQLCGGDKDEREK
jgi:hypothetical protein